MTTVPAAAGDLPGGPASRRDRLARLDRELRRMALLHRRALLASRAGSGVAGIRARAATGRSA